MKAVFGRPENPEGRLPRETRCYELLDSLGIEYLRVDHEAADTMEVCLERTAVLGTRICKNLFLCNRQETKFYLLLMPADKQFRTSVVSGQLGVSRLHFADEKHLEPLLGLQAGSVSVLGLVNDPENKVRLLIDRELCDQEFFSCHPCVNTASLKFLTAELFEKILPVLGHSPTFVDLPGEDAQ